MSSSTYSDTDIDRRVAEELPGWRYEGGHLTREFQTGDWRRGSLLAGAIAFLAEAAFHHPDVVLGFPTLTVRLRSHEADGITDADFELAEKIEGVAGWRPASGSEPTDGWIS